MFVARLGLASCPRRFTGAEVTTLRTILQSRGFTVTAWPCTGGVGASRVRLAPLVLAHVACIAYARCMQYTIRNIPAHVDRALRERSVREGKSLNEIAIEALERGLDLEGQPVRRRDLSAITGSWVRDREVDRALDDQRTIDPDLWR